MYIIHNDINNYIMHDNLKQSFAYDFLRARVANDESILKYQLTDLLNMLHITISKLTRYLKTLKSL